MTVVEHGASIGMWMGKSIPAYIVTSDGRRYEYVRKGTLDADGGFEMSQLRADECVLSPGIVYRETYAFASS